jgi:hypothetical protein
MDKAAVDVPRWRFSTDALPECERGAAVDALYGRHTVMAFEALPDVPVYVDFTQRQLPGLLLTTGTTGTALTERTRRHLLKKDCSWPSSDARVVRIDWLGAVGGSAPM